MYELSVYLHSLVPWGTDVIIGVQSWRTPWFDALFMAASLDKRGALFALLLPLIYWCVDRSLGVELIYLNILAQFATASVKLAFAIPRPESLGIESFGRMPESYSFPSGHAQVAVTIFGYLAIKARNPWLRLFWLSLIPLTSFSRVYLGVHYPQDVIGGILIGVISIGLFCLLYPPIKSWTDTQSLTLLVILSLASATIPLLLYLFTGRGANSFQPALLASGLLAGVNLGLIMENKFVGFSVEGPWGKRLLRAIVGLSALGLLYGAVGLVGVWLAADVTISLLAQWLQYCLVGWGLACGAPWLFTVLSLSQKTIAADSELAPVL
jgi:membrane-associated phospholipid phosphatase